MFADTNFETQKIMTKKKRPSSVSYKMKSKDISGSDYDQYSQVFLADKSRLKVKKKKKTKTVRVKKIRDDYKFETQYYPENYDGNLYDKYKEEDASLWRRGQSIETANSGKYLRAQQSGCAVGCHQHFTIPRGPKKQKVQKTVIRTIICPPKEDPSTCCAMLVRNEMEYQAKRRQERYLKAEQMEMFRMTLERKKNQHKEVNYHPYFYNGGPIATPQQFNSGCDSNTVAQSDFKGFGIAG